MHKNASDIVKTKGEKLVGKSYNELRQQLKEGEVIVAIYNGCTNGNYDSKVAIKTEHIINQEVWGSVFYNYVIKNLEFFALSHVIYENILKS